MPNQDRQSRWQKLKSRERVSVLVVGGGINGIGSFRDLVLQGIDVVLVDKGDFCCGASSAPSRMIHGGLRYLEHGEFELVKESLKERDLLLRNAPHFVGPLETTIPIFDVFSGVWQAALRFFGNKNLTGRRGAMIIKAGLSFYDFFTRRGRLLPKHRMFGAAATRKRWPDLNPGVVCSASYFDAWITHPERLAMELITDTEAADEHNALALNYVRAQASEAGAVVLKDEISGETTRLRPDVVVNATGAWVDFTNGAVAHPPGSERPAMVGGTKGSHLILRHDRLLKALRDQMIYFENAEGRICIAFPYFGNVLVGSTDIRIDDPEGVRCEPDEQQYILDALSFVFPGMDFSPDDIIYRFSGVRPLPHSDNEVTGQISRDHHCRVLPADNVRPYPVVCLIGGKWTTFRAFGEMAADHVLGLLGRDRLVRTDDIAIGGGRDFPLDPKERAAWIADLANRHAFPLHRVTDLLERYGTKARQLLDFLSAKDDRTLYACADYTFREIVWLIRHELVVRLDDLVLRRTNIAISGNLNQCLLSELNDILAAELGWSDDERTRSLDRTNAQLEYFHGLTLNQLKHRSSNKELEAYVHV